MNKTGNVLEYLERTAGRFPGRSAYRSDKESLTWSQVRRAAAHIGSGLLKRLGRPGIRPGAGPANSTDPIAILMDKEPHAITALLGVVYSGRSYVCLDSALPYARLAELLRFLKPAACLFAAETEALEEALSGLLGAASGCPRIFLEELSASELLPDELSAVRAGFSPEDTLSVTFTSSSSGPPKGVETSHRAVVRYIDGLGEILRADENTMFGNQAPFCFDASLKEIYLPMKYGGGAFFIPSGLFARPADLTELLNSRRINTICWVSSALALASALDAFAVIRPKFLHTVAFGSEVLPPNVLDYWQAALPSVRFLNLYGPTEATGMSCYYEVPGAFTGQEAFMGLYGGRIPIGKPFPGVEIRLDPEPEGEILIRSGRLAKGYYHSPDSGSRVFTTDTDGSRIYRTGDRGYRAADGNLLFLGRTDLQVKRMGFRIDLAELERLAQTCPGVGLCCCVQRQDGQIFLYLSPTEQKGFAGSGLPDTLPTRLRTYLSRLLPRYALPNRILLLDAFPMLPGGKTDRRAIASGLCYGTE